jgi:hypothetical protein
LTDCGQRIKHRHDRGRALTGECPGDICSGEGAASPMVIFARWIENALNVTASGDRCAQTNART